MREQYLKLLEEYGLEVPKGVLLTKEKIEVFKKNSNSPNDINQSISRQVMSFIKKNDIASDEKILDNSISSYATPLEKYADDILKLFDKHNEPIKDDIYFGEFPIHDFNAKIKKYSNGYLCLLNTGLLRLIYGISFAMFYPLNGNTALNNKQRTISLNMEYDEKNELFKESIHGIVARIYSYLKYDNSDAVTAYRGTINDTSMEFLGSLTFAIKSFVIAHELAHINLGHITKECNILINEKIMTVAETDIQKEFAADKKAQKILIELDTASPLYPDVYSCGGICFFYIQLMVEEIQKNMFTTSDQSTQTHPETTDRINKLIELLSTQEYTEQSITNILTITNLFEKYYIFIKNHPINIETFD